MHTFTGPTSRCVSFLITSHTYLIVPGLPELLLLSLDTRGADFQSAVVPITKLAVWTPLGALLLSGEPNSDPIHQLPLFLLCSFYIFTSSTTFLLSLSFSLSLDITWLSLACLFQYCSHLRASSLAQADACVCLQPGSTRVSCLCYLTYTPHPLHHLFTPCLSKSLPTLDLTIFQNQEPSHPNFQLSNSATLHPSPCRTNTVSIKPLGIT